eukprot:387957-Amphidinium_carterae.1
MPVMFTGLGGWGIDPVMNRGGMSIVGALLVFPLRLELTDSRGLDRPLLSKETWSCTEDSSNAPPHVEITAQGNALGDPGNNRE